MTAHCPDGYVVLRIYCSKPKSPEFYLLTSWEVQDRAHPESAYPLGFADYSARGDIPTVMGDATAGSCSYSGDIIPYTSETLDVQLLCIRLPTSTTNG